MQLAVEHGVRRTGAVTQAVHRLQGQAAVGAGLAQLQAEFFLQLGGQRLGAHRLAGLGLAQLEVHTARRAGAEVMVEADHPMYLGARQAEVFGDHWQHFGRHRAETILDVVKNGQQRARFAAVRRQHLAGDGLVLFGVEALRKSGHVRCSSRRA
ncbi:hypothetical protein D9M68_870230 [compost metagenome]